jgi:hypothetical protein
MSTPPVDLNSVLARLSEQLGGKKAERLQWIKATVGQNLRLIPVSEVLFFQSDEKYTRVVTSDTEALIKTPIRELMDGLDPRGLLADPSIDARERERHRLRHPRLPRPGAREGEGQGREPRRPPASTRTSSSKCELRP